MIRYENDPLFKKYMKALFIREELPLRNLVGSILPFKYRKNSKTILEVQPNSFIFDDEEFYYESSRLLVGDGTNDEFLSKLESYYIDPKTNARIVDLHLTELFNIPVEVPYELEFTFRLAIFVGLKVNWRAVKHLFNDNLDNVPKNLRDVLYVKQGSAVEPAKVYESRLKAIEESNRRTKSHLKAIKQPKPKPTKRWEHRLDFKSPTLKEDCSSVCARTTNGFGNLGIYDEIKPPHSGEDPREIWAILREFGMN